MVRWGNRNLSWFPYPELGLKVKIGTVAIPRNS